MYYFTYNNAGFVSQNDSIGTKNSRSCVLNGCLNDFLFSVSQGKCFICWRDFFCCPEGVALESLKTICGLKQAAFEHWKASPAAIKHIKLSRSQADPCVHFKWTDKGPMIWSSWVDDTLSCGTKAKQSMERKSSNNTLTLMKLAR